MLKIRHLAPLSLLALAGAVAAADAAKDSKPAAATTTNAGAATTSTAANAGTGSTAASAERGRDWSRIDADRDHSVSPEEMEKFLAENPGPLKK